MKFIDRFKSLTDKMTGVHWLAEAYETISLSCARDEKGVVIYFETKEACLDFIDMICLDTPRNT